MLFVVNFPSARIEKEEMEEIAMAANVPLKPGGRKLLPFNLHRHSQHVIRELMKVYDAGKKNCAVLKFPKNFSPIVILKLYELLEETFPELMTKKDENGRLRTLKVYFVMERGK